MASAPETRIAFVRGQFVPRDTATIPLMDRGFLFGDGVYEVTAVIERRFVDNGPHLDRLDRSLREIGIANPYGRAEWVGIECELMRRNALDNGLIYIQVTRGVAERDFLFPPDLAPSVVLFAQNRRVQHNPLIEKGAAVIKLPDQRWARCDIKSTSLLAQVLAKRAAAQANANEVWMTRDGYITEGASSTAFIVTPDGRLVTRTLSPAILPGVTRRTIMRIADQAGLALAERPFTRDEALGAAEAFYTSASTIAIPVTRIDGRPVANGQPGPVFRSLYDQYMQHVLEKPQDF